MVEKTGIESEQQPNPLAGVLTSDHYRMLHEESGIGDMVIRAGGVRSLRGHASELAALGIRNDAGPGIWFPFQNQGGGGYGQYRPDVAPPDKKGKLSKYLNPKAKQTELHIFGLEWVLDPLVPVVITEGWKKGAALWSRCQEEDMRLVIVVLAGVDNWTSGGNPIPGFQGVSWNGRRVTVAYDSDVMTKLGVAKALHRLHVFLKEQQAKVRYPVLPDVRVDGKTGLDDYLLVHSLRQFWELVEESPNEPPNPLPPNLFGDPWLPSKLSEIAASQPTIWVWDEVLTLGGLSLLTSKPKIGKSTLTRHLARCVGRGDPFLGRPTTRGNVLVLAFEEQEMQVSKHVEQLGLSDKDGVYFKCGSAPQHDLRALVGSLRSMITQHGFSLVILDTVNRLLRVKETNDYGEVTAAMELLQNVARETGCHIMGVHHSGKTERYLGDGALGSTAWTGSVDTIIEYTGARGSKSARYIESVGRMGVPIERTPLVFALGTLSLGDAAKKSEIDEVIRDRIRAALSDGPMMRKVLLATVTGDTDAKKIAVKLMVEGGEIQESQIRAPGSPKQYSLVQGFKTFPKMEKSETPFIPVSDFPSQSPKEVRSPVRYDDNQQGPASEPELASESALLVVMTGMEREKL